MVSRKAKLAVEKVFFNTETNLPRPKIPVINLPNLEKILQNPNTELKKQVQNQMTSEQLKHLIEDKFPMYPNGDLTGMNQVNAQRVVGAKLCLNDSSILQYCDSEVMKKAGWIRQEELNPFMVISEEYMHRLRDQPNMSPIHTYEEIQCLLMSYSPKK